jgi:16S rRNA (guanine966-N2)-methyltransferase
LRIVAGRWRGRNLVAPSGDATRPTADRVRQALFDMLLHAPWGGPETIRDVTVLDAFAGTGAMGLEALSRGARHVTFIENAPAALAALRANLRACQTEAATTVIPADVLKVRAGRDPAAGLVFLDPPYGQGLVPLALAALRASGFITPNALIVAETGRGEPETVAEPLADRVHGAARVTIWRDSQA